MKKKTWEKRSGLLKRSICFSGRTPQWDFIQSVHHLHDLKKVAKNVLPTSWSGTGVPAAKPK